MILLCTNRTQPMHWRGGVKWLILAGVLVNQILPCGLFAQGIGRKVNFCGLGAKGSNHSRVWGYFVM